MIYIITLSEALTKSKMSSGTIVDMHSNTQDTKDFRKSSRYKANDLIKTPEYEYDGETYKGLPHGNGVMVKDSNKYIGQFKYGKLNGNCHVYYKNGSEYKGEYAKDLKHGYGEYSHINNKPNKSYVYVGNFYKGRMSGQGMLTCANGKIITGLFDHTVDCINQENTAYSYVFGYGEITYTDGNYYKGECEYSQAGGDGKLYGKDKKLLARGKFKDDKLHTGIQYSYMNGKIYEFDAHGNAICSAEQMAAIEQKFGQLVELVSKLEKRFEDLEKKMDQKVDKPTQQQDIINLMDDVPGLDD